jgi:hypothetical protein
MHLDEQTFWAADSFVERTRSDAIQNEGFVSPGQLPPQAVLDGPETRQQSPDTRLHPHPKPPCLSRFPKVETLHAKSSQKNA